jgi:hypothetical protein
LRQPHLRAAGHWDKYIPQKNRDFAKTHFYRDADRLFLVRNGRISLGTPISGNTLAKPGIRG